MLGAVDEVDDVGQQRVQAGQAHIEIGDGQIVEAEGDALLTLAPIDQELDQCRQRGHRAHDGGDEDDLIADERDRPALAVVLRQRLADGSRGQCREGEGKEPHVRS